MTDVKTQVLTDKTASGRERPWKDHRTGCEYLAAAYDDIDERKADRVRGCATELHFSVGKEGMKLANAWFCRVRLCPMCSWRRSLKVGAQMQAILDALAGEGYRYLMLTLTRRNVVGEYLDQTLDDLMKSWDRMFRRKRVKDAVKGWYRAVEITHNLNDNTYHPHIHAVLAVAPGYFSGGRYVKQDEWKQLWREAMRADYDPSVDIRTVKGSTAAAIAEVAKYAVKSDDYIIPDDWDLTQETITLLDQVLANRRFIGYGGVFKEMHRKLKLEDAEDGDLVNIDGEAPASPSEQTITFVWYSGYRQYLEAPANS